MTTLEQLKLDKMKWAEVVRTKTYEYEIAKKALKKVEQELKATKKNKNKIYKDLTYGKYKVVQLDTKIKTMPSRLRKWSKDNTGKVINKILG